MRCKTGEIRKKLVFMFIILFVHIFVMLYNMHKSPHLLLKFSGSTADGKTISFVLGNLIFQTLCRNLLTPLCLF